MPIPPSTLTSATAVQHAAAHDSSTRVRLIAGPGTGKSASIEERVCWLIQNGVTPQEIYAISFTRASVRDLRDRIHSHCTKHNVLADQVQISTLHSLALRLLSSAGLLQLYPVDPQVLDDWELENLFDEEFRIPSSIPSKPRRENIRLFREAFWQTGQSLPPNYISPNPPVTAAEEQMFVAFHQPFTQTYACVLPGEMVRRCVEAIQAGLLDSATILAISHLIVDEYQDLNPMDLQLVSSLMQANAAGFVAGDDDQSIYSFRYADPSGLQAFSAQNPGTAAHTLNHCFRCTPSVLAASQVLINAFPLPNRIPKQPVSVYAGSTPPVAGIVERWRFGSGVAEASAIAASCQALIGSSVAAKDILILLSNSRALLKPITDSLSALAVPFEPPRPEGFLDTECGRLVSYILRIVCDRDDLVAYRALLKLRSGVGTKTSHEVLAAIVGNNTNVHTVVYGSPPTIFGTRATTAVAGLRSTCQTLSAWNADETLVVRTSDIASVVTAYMGANAAVEWQTYSANLPPAMTLKELCEYIRTENVEQQAQVLHAVFERLGQTIPADALVPDRVRIMTMHGAKGLSARVVFVPALEEAILPGPRRTPYPGLVLEAARLLYVSITRARAACYLSYAQMRVVNGAPSNQAPSRFCAHLGGAFAPRMTGITPVEAAAVAATIAQL